MQACGWESVQAIACADLDGVVSRETLARARATVRSPTTKCKPWQLSC